MMYKKAPAQRRLEAQVNQEIQALIEKHGPLSTLEINRLRSTHSRNTRNSLLRMQDEGLIKKNTDGKWINAKER